MADLTDGPVRRLAVRRRRVRDVLRLHRRREQPVGSRRCTTARPRSSRRRPPRRDYHLTEDLADRAVRLGAPAEGADARQTVLRVLRPGRHPCAAPRAEGVGGQVRRAVRRRVGRAAGADLRAAEGAGRDPRRRRAHRSPRRDHRVGRHARGAQAGARAPDGGLRRLPGAHRPPRRPADRRHRRSRRPGQHDRLLHHRRQRRVRRGHDERRLQRDGQLQRDGSARDARVHAQQDGRARLTGVVQPLLGRLGLGDEHPLQWTKQVASHWGGTRNGTIVHWPAGIAEQGGLRSQFTHVIDLAPTVLEAAGLPEPTMVNGVQQSPMEGTSMLYTFNEPDAPERHDLQYFEMFGNRGIYHKGWSAVTKHKHTVDHGRRRAARLRRRPLGAVRRHQRLQPGARPRRRAPGCWPSCSGCG